MLSHGELVVVAASAEDLLESGAKGLLVLPLEFAELTQDEASLEGRQDGLDERRPG